MPILVVVSLKNMVLQEKEDTGKAGALPPDKLIMRRAPMSQ